MSMFGGLDLKGSSTIKSKEKLPNTTVKSVANLSPTTSGFSFLSSATDSTSSGVIPTSIAEPQRTTSSASSSAFKFLSSMPSNNTNGDDKADETSISSSDHQNSKLSSDNITNSRFSFLVSSGSDGVSAKTSSDDKETIENDTTVTSIGERENITSSSAGGVDESNSIFSMLAASMPNPITALPTSEGNTSNSVPNGINANPHNTQSSPWTKISSASSTKPDVVPSTTIHNPSNPPSVDTVNPAISSVEIKPTHKNNTSTAAAQPLGSGMVFGNAARQRSTIIKKRPRIKKVGVMSNNSNANSTHSTANDQQKTTASMTITSARSEISLSSSSTTTITSTPKIETKLIVEESDKPTEDMLIESKQSTYLQDLAKRADEAASNADRFMSEKSNASNTYTGRYATIGRKMVIEDYGNNGGTVIVDDDVISEDGSKIDEDATYAQAKAAAEEAKTMTGRMMSPSPSPSLGSNNSGSGRIGGLLGGLFKRNGYGSTNAGTSTGNVRENVVPNEIGSGDDRVKDKEIVKDKIKVTSKLDQQEKEIHQGEEHTSYNNNVRGSGIDQVSKENTTYLQFKKRQPKQEQEQEQEQLCQQTQAKPQPHLQPQPSKNQVEEKMGGKEKEEKEERILVSNGYQKEEEDGDEDDKQRLEIISSDSPKKDMTPEEEFDSLLQFFSSKCKKATSSASEMRQQRKAILLERSMTEKQVSLAIQQISQAEMQQTDAAEAEDFDLADSLAGVIEGHIKEREKYDQDLEEVKEKLDALNTKRCDAVGNITNCFLNLREELVHFLSTHNDNSSLLGISEKNSDVLKRFEETTQRLSIEDQRLLVDLKNLERDEGYLEEERNEVEATISENTKDIEKLRNAAGAKLDEINKEIELLRKELANKLAEADCVRKELTSNETAIAHVRSKFSRQLIRLNRKESAIKESRSEWEAEHASYTNMKQTHEAVVEAHSKAMIKREQLCSNINLEISSCDKLVKIMAEDVFENTGVIICDDEDDFLKMQDEVLKFEAAIDKLNQNLTSTQAEKTNLLTEIANIEIRLPALEEKKRSAASARDFKAAAKASKEIKEAQARKIFCENQLEVDVKKREEETQNDLETCVKSLEEKKSIAHEKEKKRSVEQMEMLVKKINKIEHIKQDFCLSADEEGVEGENSSASVRIVAAHVLDGEISSLRAEGEELGAKFGEWENILSKLYNGHEDQIELNDPKDEKEISESSIPDGITRDKANCNVSLACKGSSDDKVPKSVLIDGEEKVHKQQIRKDGSNRFQEITLELKKIADELEIAVENEDYDEAAILDEKLQDLKNELESLGGPDGTIDSVDAENNEGEEKSTSDENENIDKTNRSDDENENLKKSEELVKYESDREDEDQKKKEFENEGDDKEDNFNVDSSINEVEVEAECEGKGEAKGEGVHENKDDDIDEDKDDSVNDTRSRI